eukprot:gene6578-9044_t
MDYKIDLNDQIGFEDFRLAYSGQGVANLKDIKFSLDQNDNSARELIICQNLKKRLSSDCIYTYLGSHTLVACNPFKWISLSNSKSSIPLYGQQIMSYYSNFSADLSRLPPHIFSIAASAHKNLIVEGQNQIIILLGESGSGKTEASKQIQAYLANLYHLSGVNDSLKESFLNSNVVLEAFGNCKTINNNNCSRFCKYLQLWYDRFGYAQHGLVSIMLFESAKVTSRYRSNESNFHIFYQLISSPHRTYLGLDTCQPFNYLSNTNGVAKPNPEDQTHFNKTVSSLHRIGFKSDAIKSILSIVAAILHLGNFTFESVPVEDQQEQCLLSPSPSVDKFCDLMQIDRVELENSLIKLEFLGVSSFQSTAKAKKTRDLFAKLIYQKVFNFIVNQINKNMCRANSSAGNTDVYNSQVEETIDSIVGASPQLAFIGILDPIGMCYAEESRSDHLFINYFGEKIHQFYLDKTINLEQQEYALEGIAWSSVPVVNNRIVCDLLDGSHPPGILHVLTNATITGTRFNTMEQNRRLSISKDSHKEFLESIRQYHTGNPKFDIELDNFIVKHYSCDVSYKCNRNFIESNRNYLPSSICNMMKTSRDVIVLNLFEYDLSSTASSQQTCSSEEVINQYNLISSSIESSFTQFVICIKPNKSQRPAYMDVESVAKTVASLHLAESIQIRKAGFAHRIEYSRFCERFSLLSGLAAQQMIVSSDQTRCNEILKTVAKRYSKLKEEIQFGKTKIFIRSTEAYHAIVQVHRMKVNEYVSKIQKCWRKMTEQRNSQDIRLCVSKVFVEEGKARRRDSLLRPYKGIYLENLSSNESVRKGILRIIEFHGPNETILFVDFNCHQVLLAPNNPDDQNTNKISYERRLIVLTTASIYLMEVITEKSWKNELLRQGVNPAKQMPPPVFLRIRVPLTGVGGLGELESINLSKFNDNCIILAVKLGSIATPDTSRWKDDNKVKKCPLTGKEFSIFSRKHHCRLTGDIFSDAVVDFRQCIPSLGWTSPQRVADPFIGLGACDPLEDLVLFMDRKTEFAVLLAVQWQKLTESHTPISSDRSAPLACNLADVIALNNGSRVHSSFPVSIQKIIEDRKLMYFRSLRGLLFNNRVCLRPCRSELSHLSVLPAYQIQFLDKMTDKNHLMNSPSSVVNYDSPNINDNSADGSGTIGLIGSANNYETQIVLKNMTAFRDGILIVMSSSDNFVTSPQVKDYLQHLRQWQIKSDMTKLSREQRRIQNIVRTGQLKEQMRIEKAIQKQLSLDQSNQMMHATSVGSKAHTPAKASQSNQYREIIGTPHIIVLNDSSNHLDESERMPGMNAIVDIRNKGVRKGANYSVEEEDEALIHSSLSSSIGSVEDNSDNCLEEEEDDPYEEY